MIIAPGLQIHPVAIASFRRQSRIAFVPVSAKNRAGHAHDEVEVGFDRNHSAPK
jgi:hypothetical protein